MNVTWSGNLRDISAITALILAGSVWAGAVLAEADGPDYFRVVDVVSNDVLNIRAAPTARAAKIGAIPPDGDGILNHGCINQMSYAQWQAASPAEREKARKRVWCEISYRGIRGWVAGWFLAEGNAP
ncbi:hypothetical protein [Roseovarius ramblicola]|uniref:Bacterial SH3 domain protein n=1 Tax=Roseovarius ramblicola TaxID=2022336 RepID=A0ABV5I4J8_9RHOB